MRLRQQLKKKKKNTIKKMVAVILNDRKTFGWGGSRKSNKINTSQKPIFPN